MDIAIQVRWDEEAAVFYATSEDVPGLATEADSLDALVKKLDVMIPELLEENCDEPPLLDEYAYSIRYQTVTKRKQRAA